MRWTVNTNTRFFLFVFILSQNEVNVKIKDKNKNIKVKKIWSRLPIKYKMMLEILNMCILFGFLRG